MQHNLTPPANWTKGWGYNEGWSLCSGLILAGFLLQWTIGSPTIEKFNWPYNLLFLLGFIVVLTAAFIFLKNNFLIRWLSGIPAAVTAMVATGILVIFMGIVPQQSSSVLEHPSNLLMRLGLTDFTNSWPFVFIFTYFFITLGLVTIRRSTPFTRRNIGFLLNHAGLWITLAAGLLGSADLKRYTMQVTEGDTVWQAVDERGKAHEMPLAIKLIDFHIDDYNPKLGVVNMHTQQLLPTKKPQLVLLEPLMTNIELLNWQIRIDTFYTEAAQLDSNSYLPAKVPGLAPVAYVTATHAEKTVSGWITPGSPRVAPAWLPLGDGNALVLTTPEPKRYSSEVVIYTQSGDITNALIEVNKPIKAEGWNIYQYSYDEKMGKWSTQSVFQLVRDPWLPVVYFGLILLMTGSGYLFWQGRKEKQTEEEQ